jgi:hypothetical protein
LLASRLGCRLSPDPREGRRIRPERALPLNYAISGVIAVPEDIDPEIAALLGNADEEASSKAAGGPTGGAAALESGKPDFAALFGEPGEAPQDFDSGEAAVDLTRKTFAPVERVEAERPATWFSDPAYYKTVMNGEGEEAQKLHEILGKYLKASDPKDKGVFRQQLVPAFWYVAGKIALHSTGSSAPMPKKLLLRFGALLPTLLSPEMADLFQRIIFEKTIDEPVYYVDEWISSVASGEIAASATDEISTRRSGGSDEKARTNATIQKAQGKRDAADGILRTKAEERRTYEAMLREKVQLACAHEEANGVARVPAPYVEAQKKALSEIYDIVRRAVSADAELQRAMSEFERADEELRSANDKAGSEGDGEAGETKADLQTLAQEFETIRQMNKLCIGRQGNSFPLLSREYFHGGIRDIGTRENVIRLLAWIESIDCEAYCRSYKGTLNRIVPNFILLPSYGDTGICWEPFERHNRATSRARVALPMYPKSLQTAVISAVADLRWQVAKEKAAHYWMEEGLTGSYYQWFTAKKMKGDMKEFFIQDYIIWITKESEGTQKLDRDVRAFFWRFLPFSKDVKEKLKTRSYIYQELCQKDLNRSLSDGY